ncbi:arabinose efflux permease family protein [Desulfosporosinus acidiphilus SJ4]|uniref:Arabinose efflux permease family protein n=1 Tax=Desulfosporosinus acidiphilus (strain DSM 22704 / JCM 16185 / SJ4) TaxID=646529 RepID=I4D474_DESAJ|nr:MFS transporter [Desulfosporosinus acidiphilus]AFM40598.1 arabinose efflux permease family protein [Desulfosporosinus acidiphilus SJ4]
MSNTATLTNKLTRTFPAFSHKNFRYFWSGQCISLMGTWMQTTAQQWLVYTITKSAFLLGLLGVAQFGPMLVFSLFAGVLADKFPKKAILIFTQSALMVQAFILAGLVLSEHVQYWQVLVLAAALGLVNTLDMPTRQAFMVELVGREDLTNAIALNSTIVNLARIIGPTLAALLMSGVGAGICFLLNALSFIPVIIGLSLIQAQPIRQSKKAEKNMLKSVVAGLRYIYKMPVLAYAVLAVLAVGTFIMNTNVLFPVFADQVLHEGVNGYGFLLSAMGFGSLIGAMLVATKARRNPSRRVMFISSLLLSAIMVSIFFIRSSYPAMLLVAALGLFNIIFMNTVNSTLQLNSTDEYRGRVMSVYSLALGGTTPIGNLFAGGFTEKYGPSVGFLMCGIATGIILAAIIIRTQVMKKKQSAVG